MYKLEETQPELVEGCYGIRPIPLLGESVDRRVRIDQVTVCLNLQGNCDIS